MATIKRFEDLIVWQKARELSREVYKSFNVETFKRLNLSPDYGFIDQIRRAAVSVMSNIAEGFERGTQAELIHFLFIAKASCGEVRSQLYIALDNGYLDVETFKRLNRLSEDCSVLIYRFIQSVKRSGVAGHQFKKEKSVDERKRLEFDIKNFEFIRERDPEAFEKYYKYEYERLKKVLNS